MRNKTTFMSAVMMIMLTISSCKKDEQENEEAVSEQESAEVISKSMDSDNSGLVEQIEESVEMANLILQNPVCALQYDSTIVKSYSSAKRSLSYTFNWGYQVNCTNNIPSNVTLNYASDGSYTSIRMDGNDEATGAIVLTQLLSSQSSYMADIDYERIGNQTSKIGNESSFSSTLTITGSGIEVDKTSYEVLGGSASFAISGSSDNGNVYSFSGSISFLGNGQATVSFSNGSQYTISI